MDADRREKLVSQLSAYLDYELSAEERAEVEAFLAEDENARRLLVELRITVAAVRGLPRARSSDDLMDALRARLERRALLDDESLTELVAASAPAFRGKWLAAAAVIALTFTAGYLMWPLSQPMATPRTEIVKNEPRGGAPAGPEAAARSEPGKAEPARPPDRFAAADGEVRAKAAMKSSTEGHTTANEIDTDEELKQTAPRLGKASVPSRESPAGKGEYDRVAQAARQMADADDRPADVYKLPPAAGGDKPAGELASARALDNTTVIELVYDNKFQQQEAVAALQSRFEFQQNRVQRKAWIDATPPPKAQEVSPAQPGTPSLTAAPPEGGRGLPNPAILSTDELAAAKSESETVADGQPPPTLAERKKNEQAVPSYEEEVPELELEVPDEPAVQGVIADLRVQMPDARLTVVQGGELQVGQAPAETAAAPDRALKGAAITQNRALVNTSAPVNLRDVRMSRERLAGVPADASVDSNVAPAAPPAANQITQLSAAPTTQPEQRFFSNLTSNSIRLYVRVQTPTTQPAGAPAATTAPE